MNEKPAKPWYSEHSLPLSVMLVASFLLGHVMGDRIVPAWSQFIETLLGG